MTFLKRPYVYGACRKPRVFVVATQSEAKPIATRPPRNDGFRGYAPPILRATDAASASTLRQPAIRGASRIHALLQHLFVYGPIVALTTSGASTPGHPSQAVHPPFNGIRLAISGARPMFSPHCIWTMTRMSSGVLGRSAARFWNPRAIPSSEPLRLPASLLGRISVPVAGG